MRIVDIRERTVPLSRYADPAIAAELATCAVAVVTDLVVDGEPVVGYGFSSFGRHEPGGLIRDRFAPRLLAAPVSPLLDREGHLDPLHAWNAMMRSEKPGRFGNRSVAAGTLDMALWDAAAKAKRQPLHRYLARLVGASPQARASVQVYASGGYRYPGDDAARLSEEIGWLASQGFRRVKIKIGGHPIRTELRRIEAALRRLPPAGCLAVDAMHAYELPDALAMADALTALEVWWFEDPTAPLDFQALSRVIDRYEPPVGVGEALFSLAEAKLLARHGGLRMRDVLQFDPVFCGGLPEYLRIVRWLERNGHSRRSFWPHGGHLFVAHVTAALGLGGSEVNPHNFQPFGGLADGSRPEADEVSLPDVPGIGFETRVELHRLFRSVA